LKLLLDALDYTFVGMFVGAWKPRRLRLACRLSSQTIEARTDEANTEHGSDADEGVLEGLVHGRMWRLRR
jgi:hypothetical protein